MHAFIGFLIFFICVADAVVNMGRYRQQILDIHNDVRRMEPAADMQKLKWNMQLERESAAWASRCVFDHQSQGRGENLAMHTAPWDYSRLINVGIQMWADEKNQYRYGSSGFSQATGHYTQMVWADTTDVGCAMTRCPSLSMGAGGSPMGNAWFLVCFYSPPGNFIGQLPYKQGQKCSMCGRGQICDRGLCSSGAAPVSSPSGGVPSKGTGHGVGSGHGHGHGGHSPIPSGPSSAGGHHMTPVDMGPVSTGPIPSGPHGSGGSMIPIGSNAPLSGGLAIPVGPSSGGTFGGHQHGAGGGHGSGMPNIELLGGFPGSPSGGSPIGAGLPTSGGTQVTSIGTPGSPPIGTSFTRNTPFGTFGMWEWSTGLQPRPQQTGSSQSCRDTQSWCSMWAELCSDPNHSRKMSSQCPATCGRCQSSAGPRASGATGPCADTIEGCTFMQQTGMCNVPFFQTYMMETCALTCGLC